MMEGLSSEHIIVSENSTGDDRRVTRGQLARNSKNAVTTTPTLRVMKRKSNSNKGGRNSLQKDGPSDAKKAVITATCSTIVSPPTDVTCSSEGDVSALDQSLTPKKSEEEVKGLGSQIDLVPGKENGQIVRLDSGKLVRVMQKPSLVSVSREDGNGSATATITASNPIDLNAILGGEQIEESHPNDSSTENAQSVCDPSTSHDENHLESGLVADTTCISCVSQLPTIRKSLGRLELRLDTMMGMVRTLISRTSVTSNMAASTQNPRGGVNTSLSANCSSILENPIRARLSQALFARALEGRSPSSRVVNRDPSSSGTATHAYRIPSAIACSGKSSLPSNKGPTPEIGQSNFSESSVKEAAVEAPLNQTNPANLVNKLFKTDKHTTNGSFPTDGVNMKRKVARSLLLSAGTEFTYKAFMDSAPYDVQKASKKMIHSVILSLMEDNLLYTDDPEVRIPTDTTTLQKEKAKNKLKLLKKYDVSLPDYMRTLLPNTPGTSYSSTDDAK